MNAVGFIDSLLEQGAAIVVPLGVDYFGILVSALTGALFACQRKLDPVGTVVLGLITAYGGGLMRDLILQNHGIYLTEHPDLILICTLLCLFVFYFRSLFKRLDTALLVCDSLSIALFTLAGASKALSCGQTAIISVVLGVVTAVGGGALRNVFVGETPDIFKRANYYALACLGGAVVYVVLVELGCPVSIAGALCVVVTLALRFASIALNLKTRQEADLTPAVKERLGKIGKQKGEGE